MTYPHGLFSWADLSSPDPAVSKDFYTGLFGWDADEQHFPDGSLMYVMFSRDGKSVAGLGPQPPQMTAQGIPPIWNSYVSVDSVDDTIKKWTDAGGTVVVPAMDVMTSGRMAFVADPEGATVGLWEAGDHVGAQVFNLPGAMTWNELQTRNADTAREFYGNALGWEFAPFEGSQPVYWLLTLPGKPQGDPLSEDSFNGGMLTLDESFPPEMPAHWMIYFHVGDTDESVAKVEELGGTVIAPAMDMGTGRMAVVADPLGGAFAIIAPPQQA